MLQDVLNNLRKIGATNATRRINGPFVESGMNAAFTRNPFPLERKSTLYERMITGERPRRSRSNLEQLPWQQATIDNPRVVSHKVRGASRNTLRTTPVHETPYVRCASQENVMRRQQVVVLAQDNGELGADEQLMPDRGRVRVHL